MKRKIFVLLLITVNIIIINIYFKNDLNYVNTINNNYDSNHENLSMMLETSAGSGEYQKTTANAWPTEGYVFNSTLSKCKNGSNLTWDNDKNQVIFEGNKKDDCYIYFDKTITLVDYVKAQYTGTQGENNLYLHDSTLTNGAGDNSYRYAGSSDTTNNFVCFGYDSTDGSCPTDNLYRIIGVFDNQVKLIKFDYANSNLLGTDGDYKLNTYSKSDSLTYKGALTTINRYYWNNNNASQSRNVWSLSRLNKTNLNTNYINNLETKWTNKIISHTWQVGGNTLSKIEEVEISNAYQNEIKFPVVDTPYDAKVGLMYVSDYGFASDSSSWINSLAYYNGELNWMYMGLNEWTITRMGDNSNAAYYVHDTGKLNAYYVYFYSGSSDYAIRPTFYLDSNIRYISGKGTKTEPIIIE